MLNAGLISKNDKIKILGNGKLEKETRSSRPRIQQIGY
jgi:hypothetical protein